MTSSSARRASSWFGLLGLLSVVAGEMGECCCVLSGGRLCVVVAEEGFALVGVGMASDALDAAVCCCEMDADNADDEEGAEDVAIDDGRRIDECDGPGSAPSIPSGLL